MFTRPRPWMLFGLGIVLGAAGLSLLKDTREVQAEPRPNLAGLQAQIDQLKAQVTQLQGAGHTFDDITGDFTNGQYTNLDGRYSLGTHTHPIATSSVSGFLSAPDKVKIDSLGSTYALKIHTHGFGEITGDFTNGQYTNLDGRYSLGTHTHAVATPSNNGFMSAADSATLNSVSSTYALKTHTHSFADITGTVPAGSIADNSITNNKLASDAASLAKVSGGSLSSNGLNLTTAGSLLVFANLTAGNISNQSLTASGNITATGKVSGGSIQVGSSNSPPSVADAASRGTIYFNTSTNKLMVSDGTQWVSILTDADAAATYLPKAGGTVTGNLTVSGNLSCSGIISGNGGAITNVTNAGASSLQGRPMSAAAPASGQAIKWNGSSWAPSN